jgi:hypothetical protein
MANVSMKQIREEAVSLLAQAPGGIRFMKLVKAVRDRLPEANSDSVFTQISELHKSLPGKVIKPSRGLYQLATDAAAEEKDVVADTVVVVGGSKLKEQDFYAAFATFLKTDLDEATEAESLGGAGLKGKWATPDVIGAYKPSAADLVKFPIELISAEVKIDVLQPVVAFGQAIAYRLFSHKTYMAMPTSMSEADQSRLEALAMLFGVGLVLFDLNVEKPNFSIRVRAQ